MDTHVKKKKHCMYSLPYKNNGLITSHITFITIYMYSLKISCSKFHFPQSLVPWLHNGWLVGGLITQQQF